MLWRKLKSLDHPEVILRRKLLTSWALYAAFWLGGLAHVLTASDPWFAYAGVLVGVGITGMVAMFIMDRVYRKRERGKERNT